MLIPEFWAEARKQHRDGKRQCTVRRFGWSNDSQDEAQHMAESRANEALARLLAGERIERREAKTAYNGADGVPIREEVLSRHGEEVVTRNGYGAHCLNTPRALFADIDFDTPGRAREVVLVLGLLTAASVLTGLSLHRWDAFFVLTLLSLALALPLTALLRRLLIAVRGGPDRLARRRILAFLARHPDWNLRLYTTPNGLRLLATHRLFSADEPEVGQFFAAVGTDPVYVRMCQKQGCFRARLTAKPWRIGMSAHLRPRPGVWPVDPARLPLRQQWVAQYEHKAAEYAACRFVESLGGGKVHRDLRQVVELHDRESRAGRPNLALA